MEIVDAQIHNSPLRKWLGRNPNPQAAQPVVDFEAELDPGVALRVVTEIALSAMNAVGVDAAVIHHVQPVTLADLESSPIPAVAATKLYPDKFGGVVTPSPELTTDIGEMLSQVRTRFGLVAIRMIPAWPKDGPTLMPRVREGGFDDWFRAAQKHDVPICLMMAGHLPEAGKIAARFPDLTLIVDHLGMYPRPPTARVDEQILSDLPELIALAQFPNIAVKFTGVAALSLEPYPFADLWPRLHKVIDAFGPDRLMWGSDYTRTATLHSYSEALNFLRYSDEVSNADKEKML